MDRKLLAILLQSGPARKFDIRYFVTRSPNQEKEDLLFQTCFLNKSILFKYSVFETDGTINTMHPVRTLVYLPYDPAKPGDGGESFLFSKESYEKFCEFKKKFRHEEVQLSERDLDILAILDSVPTFSPLILELAFQRAGIAIPDIYLDLTDDMRMMLKSLMKSRVRPLIVAAFGNQPCRVENAVEELTSKVFTLQNISEIMPFVAALRLPPSHAVDLMASWVGITYFEHEYTSVQRELQGVANFLNSKPHEAISIARVNREEVHRTVEYIRGRLKDDWAKIRDLSTEYKNMYEELVFNGDIMGFRNFLLKCKTSYWELGDLLGRLEQTAIAWNAFQTHSRMDLSTGVLLDFLHLLRTLNTVMPINATIEGQGLAADSGFAALSADLF